MNSSEFSYHDSLKSWYFDFLQVAVSSTVDTLGTDREIKASDTFLQLQRHSWPVDTYAAEEDFKPVLSGLEKAHPKIRPRDLSEDKWSEPFLLKGNNLVKQAQHHAEENKTKAAIELYM